MTPPFLGIDHVPFNHRLRTARTRMGMSRRGLADACGISNSQVGSYEALKVWPTRKVQERIAEALQDDPDYIFPVDVGVALRGHSARTVTTVLPFEEVLLSAPGMPMLLASDPQDDYAATELGEVMHGVVDQLPKRERMVLAWHYGLDGAPPRTLDEISREMRVTKERVRQLEAKALRRLRHPYFGAPLRAFVW